MADSFPDGQSPPSRASRRTRRAAAVLGGIAAVAVLVLLQAWLVGTAFSGPLGDGDGRLPASLRGLASGPGPVAAADLPFVVPLAGSAAGGESAEPQTPVDSQSPVGVASGVPLTLTPWAAELAPQVGIPPVALAAYGAAQLTVAASRPECHLSWPTLAGIGSVESDHGRFAGATLGADGRSRPPIIGLPLDGGPGVARIVDTDGGALDGDTALDHAVGAMQFIPTTWERWGADGDADGRRDPFDLDDAALAAAEYLCAAGGDLATSSGWTRAVYAYNAAESYVISVRGRADDYAHRSQVGPG